MNVGIKNENAEPTGPNLASVFCLFVFAFTFLVFLLLLLFFFLGCCYLLPPKLNEKKTS